MTAHHKCRPETCGGVHYDPCEQALREVSPADRCACGDVTVDTAAGHVAWPFKCRPVTGDAESFRPDGCER